MNIFNRPWIYFGFSASMVATIAVLVGMSNHKEPVTRTKPELKFIESFSDDVLSAKDILQDQLTRRFTEVQNVNFGMNRVISAEDAARSRTMNVFPLETRKAHIDGYESRGKHKQASNMNRKPIMTPENIAESKAIQTLKDSGLQVAIYTIGQFEHDRNPKPLLKPLHLNNRYPHSLRKLASLPTLRAKGPAYINPDTKAAPRAYEVINFGRKAWASGEENFAMKGEGGWTYFARLVTAPDKSCGSCHKPQEKPKGAQPSLKAGDSVGLFVIAMKRT